MSQLSLPKFEANKPQRRSIDLIREIPMIPSFYDERYVLGRRSTIAATWLSSAMSIQVQKLLQVEILWFGELYEDWYMLGTRIMRMPLFVHLCLHPSNCALPIFFHDRPMDFRYRLVRSLRQSSTGRLLS